MTVPTQRAPPKKKTRRRQTKEEKALRINFRGFSDSPAVMEMNSGPTILHDMSVILQVNAIDNGHRRERALDYTGKKSEKSSGVSGNEILDKCPL